MHTTSRTSNHHNSEYLGLRGLTMGFKNVLKSIFWEIREFDSSQMNLYELFSLIVRERNILRYSFYCWREIVSLYKKKLCVYLIKNIFYTFFRIHFGFFFSNIWFFQVLKRRKKNLQNEKTLRPVKFHKFFDFWAKNNFMNFHLKGAQTQPHTEREIVYSA